MISGETRLAAVIGDPVRHSRSPAIHNAAYAAAGLDWVFVALAVPAGRGADAVRAMPVLGIVGPQRHDAAQGRRGAGLRRADARDATALERREHGRAPATTARSAGDSTDGEGLAAQPGRRRARRRRAAGARGRRRRRGARRGRSRSAGPAPRSRSRPGGRRPRAAAAELAPDGERRRARPPTLGARTSTSSSTPRRSAWPASRSRSPAPGAGQWAVDLVYHPAETPFLGRGRGHGRPGRRRARDARPPGRARVRGDDRPPGAARRRCAPPRRMRPPTRALNDRAPAADNLRVRTSDRRTRGAVGLQGTLDTFSLAEILGLIERARQTGALAVDGPDGHGTLYVAAGPLQRRRGGGLLRARSTTATRSTSGSSTSASTSCASRPARSSSSRTRRRPWTGRAGDRHRARSSRRSSTSSGPGPRSRRCSRASTCAPSCADELPEESLTLSRTRVQDLHADRRRAAPSARSPGRPGTASSRSARC